MTVNVTKPQINLRGKLSEVDKPSGIAGEAILRSETPQEVFNYINAGRRNFIINGDFQVSQRGDYTTATAASGAAYYLDRWRTSSVGCSATIQDIGRKLKMVCTSGGTGTMRVLQKLELGDIHINKFVGQQMTVSAKVKSNSSNCRLLVYRDGWTAGENAVHTGDGTEQTLSFTFDHDVTCSTEFSILIGIDGDASFNVTVNVDDYFEVTEVQLEVGKVATPFEHRSYGEELALCQRYFEKSFNQADTPSAGLSMPDRHTGIVFATNNYGFEITFAVPKRTAPTMVYYRGNNGGSASSGTVLRYTGSAWVEENLVGSGRKAETFVVQDVLCSGLSVGEAYILQFGFTADAEL